DVKHVIWIPLGLLAIAAVAALILRQFTGSYHGQEVGFAVGIALVSAELAMVPLALSRRLGPVANFQAAFGGTLMHLFLCLAACDPTEHVSPHVLFRLGHWFAFNNQMLMALIAGILMILIFHPMFRDVRSDAPRGAKNFFESIMEFFRLEVFRPALKEHTD